MTCRYQCLALCFPWHGNHVYLYILLSLKQSEIESLTEYHIGISNRSIMINDCFFPVIFFIGLYTCPPSETSRFLATHGTAARGLRKGGLLVVYLRQENQLELAEVAECLAQFRTSARCYTQPPPPKKKSFHLTLFDITRKIFNQMQNFLTHSLSGQSLSWYSPVYSEITECMKSGARKKMHFLSIGLWRFNAWHWNTGTKTACTQWSAQTPCSIKLMFWLWK